MKFTNNPTTYFNALATELDGDWAQDTDLPYPHNVTLYTDRFMISCFLGEDSELMLQLSTDEGEVSCFPIPKESRVAETAALATGLLDTVLMLS